MFNATEIVALLRFVHQKVLSLQGQFLKVVRRSEKNSLAAENQGG